MRSPRLRSVLVTGGFVLAVGLGYSAAAWQQHQHSTQHAFTERWPVPEVLSIEHDHLHKQLAAAINAGGETGAAAEHVKGVMKPHFLREEEIAMPPLALLEPLSRGEYTSEMDRVLKLTDQLEHELSEMLSEHQQIKDALKDLAQAARSEGHAEHAQFAEKLILHAKHEEQILYPAAILVGKYVRMKSPNKN